jgi:FkbM family methyltransferase
MKSNYSFSKTIQQKVLNLRNLYRIKKHVRLLSIANNIVLQKSMTLEDCIVFIDIFHFRTYSFFFPFYTNATVFDIGAHKGYFSLFASKHLSEDSTILALEPASKNYAECLKNLEINQIQNVTLINKGLGAQKGFTKLYAGSDANNSVIEGYNRTLFNRKGNISSTIELLSLEDIFCEYKINTVDFIKIDCEGAEYESLFNCPQDILTKCKVISMEYHDLKNAQKSGVEMYKLLVHNGFSIVNYSIDCVNADIDSGKIVATRF